MVFDICLNRVFTSKRWQWTPQPPPLGHRGFVGMAHTHTHTHENKQLRPFINRCKNHNSLLLGHFCRSNEDTGIVQSYLLGYFKPSPSDLAFPQLMGNFMLQKNVPKISIFWWNNFYQTDQFRLLLLASWCRYYFLVGGSESDCMQSGYSLF